MTVKFYTDQDSKGRQWTPDHSHEVGGIFEIFKEMWLAFHHESELYVAVANMHDPSADLVVVTERGLGLVEVKHYSGRVYIGSDGYWYTATQQIKGGKYMNPHKQVQAYGDDIRRNIRKYMPLPSKFNELKFQTSVCFTHPAVELGEIQSQLIANPPKLRKWEGQFSVAIPKEIPQWVASLRFGSNLGYDNKWEPYRLEPDDIMQIVEWGLNGVKWTQAYEFMPDGKPYGYFLHTDENGDTSLFSLDKGELIIGRDAEKCQIEIPTKYRRTSRVHAKISRRIDGVYIQDLNSSNGTYVNGKRVEQLTLLSHGDIISFGASTDTKFAFKVFYSEGATPPAEPIRTARSE